MIKNIDIDYVMSACCCVKLDQVSFAAVLIFKSVLLTWDEFDIRCLHLMIFSCCAIQYEIIPKQLSFSQVVISTLFIQCSFCSQRHEGGKAELHTSGGLRSEVDWMFVI
jgi:hypothetical protein